jgi:hypothetical protein
MTPLESEVDQLRCGVARGHLVSSLCRPTDRPSLLPESASRSRTGLLEFQIDDLQSDVQRWRVRHAQEVNRRLPLEREVKTYGPSPSAYSGELLVLMPSRPTGWTGLRGPSVASTPSSSSPARSSSGGRPGQSLMNPLSFS